MTDKWNIFLSAASEKIHVPEETLDFVAVMDILMLVVSGVCSSEIVEYYKDEYELDYIESTTEKYLGFRTWSFTLEISPYSIYEQLLVFKKNDEKTFHDEVRILNRKYTDSQIKQMYDCAVRFHLLTETKENFWI